MQPNPSQLPEPVYEDIPDGAGPQPDDPFPLAAQPAGTQTEPTQALRPFPDPNLKEAGGVAFFPLYTTEGKFLLNLTVRSTTSFGALDDAIEAVNYAAQRYGLTTFPPTQQAQTYAQMQGASKPAGAPQPAHAGGPSAAPRTPQAQPAQAQPAQAATGAVERVLTAKHGKGAKAHFLIVATDRHPDGIMAFDKAIPKEWGFEQWAMWQDYTIPDGWTQCKTEPDKSGKFIVKEFLP